MTNSSWNGTKAERLEFIEEYPDKGELIIEAVAKAELDHPGLIVSIIVGILKSDDETVGRSVRAMVMEQADAWGGHEGEEEAWSEDDYDYDPPLVDKEGNVH